MQARQQLGERALRLLAEGCTVAVLRALVPGPARPVELERRLPGQAHSTIMRALAGLSTIGALSSEHRGGVPHRTIYTLTPPGAALVEIPAAAACWERRHAPGAPAQREPGTRVLRLLADPHARAILLALAGDALTLAELHAAWRSPFGRPALRKRVALLCREAILLKNQQSTAARYALAPSARRLARTALLAGRWECVRRRPGNLEQAAGIADTLRMIAPAARIGGARAGVCRLHLGPAEAGPALSILAVDGSLRVLAPGEHRAPVAEARGCPGAWCESLLGRSGRPIATFGDSEFALELRDALADVLAE
jgi:DNA-binding HxlR family transcriptional regulator